MILTGLAGSQCETFSGLNCVQFQVTDTVSQQRSLLVQAGRNMWFIICRSSWTLPLVAWTRFFPTAWQRYHIHLFKLVHLGPPPSPEQTERHHLPANKKIATKFIEFNKNIWENSVASVVSHLVQLKWSELKLSILLMGLWQIHSFSLLNFCRLRHSFRLQIQNNKTKDAHRIMCKWYRLANTRRRLR